MIQGLRKIVTFHEDIFEEGGRACPQSWQQFAVAAVLKNPWAGRGFVKDLKPEIHAIASPLGEELTRRLLEMMGGGDKVEAYGKAAIVGTDGEIEHASALTHTLRFGNHFRKAVGAESYLAFTNLRGGPGAPITIPMMDKHDAGRRSHYLTVQFRIDDAPAHDELVVAIGGSIGGRPHHRIGDRYQDIKELGGNDV